jgi:hypothetical protein
MKKIYLIPAILIAIREFYTERPDLFDSVLHFLIYLSCFILLYKFDEKSKISLKNYKTITIQDLITAYNENQFTILYSLFFFLILIYILIS